MGATPQSLQDWFSVFLVMNRTFALQGARVISNNSSFRLKHPGVSDGSDGSDGTSYHLSENYTVSVAQATAGVA
jgi:hypothetical protein